MPTHTRHRANRRPSLMVLAGLALAVVALLSVQSPHGALAVAAPSPQDRDGGILDRILPNRDGDGDGAGDDDAPNTPAPITPPPASSGNRNGGRNANDDDIGILPIVGNQNERDNADNNNGGGSNNNGGGRNNSNSTTSSSGSRSTAVPSSTSSAAPASTSSSSSASTSTEASSTPTETATASAANPNPVRSATRQNAAKSTSVAPKETDSDKGNLTAASASGGMSQQAVIITASAAGIAFVGMVAGVWVFRKGAVRPSRQFKHKYDPNAHAGWRHQAQGGPGDYRNREMDKHFAHELRH